MRAIESLCVTLLVLVLIGAPLLFVLMKVLSMMGGIAQ